jgi:hypothetical protein
MAAIAVNNIQIHATKIIFVPIFFIVICLVSSLYIYRKTRLANTGGFSVSFANRHRFLNLFLG